MIPLNGRAAAKAFYDAVDRESVYTPECVAESHPFHGRLQSFINKWNLADKKLLEIGSSKGLFQDMVQDYTGVDIATQLKRYYRKKFVVANDALLPFDDASFDAIFSYATHEHIPDIETALQELIRVLRPGGICLFAPAWHTRPWFAEGYQVRAYSTLTFRERVIKASIPLRDHHFIRYPCVLVRRLVHLLDYALRGGRPARLRFRKLHPNYGKYWQSDSDACQSLDPFDVVLWFRSRGFICHEHTSLIKTLFTRTAALELEKPR